MGAICDMPTMELQTRRRSVRAYLPQPVAPDLLRDLIATARLAPSGANLQPGSFLCVHGAARQALSAALIQAWRAGQVEQEDYSYFPQPMPQKLRRRQVAAAQALYGALGIARDDRAARDHQFERNFRFFDAPVALIVTIDPGFGPGGFMDLGMAIYGLMLAAESHGLATCAIGAVALYPGLVRTALGLETDTKIVCGMALGHADPLASVNGARTTRSALDEYFRVIS